MAKALEGGQLPQGEHWVLILYSKSRLFKLSLLYVCAWVRCIYTTKGNEFADFSVRSEEERGLIVLI